MAHDSWMYRDPMLIVQERQERERKRLCTGCAHEHAITTPFGDARMACLAGHSYGRKCRDYRERGDMTLEESDEIEALLAIWFDWSMADKARLGAPPSAPYARLSQSSGTRLSEEDAAEIADERVNAMTAEQVELCIDELPGIQYRSAIGISMRNKRGPAVWRSGRHNVAEQHQIYQQAKALLMPLLRKRNLMRT